MATSGGNARPKGSSTNNPPRNEKHARNHNRSRRKRCLSDDFQEEPALNQGQPENGNELQSRWKTTPTQGSTRGRQGGQFSNRHPGGAIFESVILERERGRQGGQFSNRYPGAIFESLRACQGGQFSNRHPVRTSAQTPRQHGNNTGSVFDRLDNQVVHRRQMNESKDYRGRGRFAQTGTTRRDNTCNRIPGYKKLQELSQQEPSEIVLVVANARNGYNELFDGLIQPHMMVMMIKVLAKVCVVDFQENKATILSMACNSKFLEKLSGYIATIPTDTNPQRKAGVPDFFQDLLLFCETIMNLLPNTACEYLGPTVLLVKVAIANASAFQNVVFPKPLTKKLEELEIHLKKLLDERAKSGSKMSSYNETLKHRPPPNDYRGMSIFPQSADILSRKRAFIRPNIVEGAYIDVDHYLDVQFRLLREDFVWPLRDGITDYLDQLKHPEKSVRRINNIRVYENVHFVRSVVEKNQIGFIVTFRTKGTGYVNWEHSKRFMFGSLLCFTSDSFESVLFGTVMDRDPKELREGRLMVRLSYESVLKELFSSTFTMVESEVYFEPYYHVLKALQVMKTEDFPMSQYIVHVQSETRPPKYLLDKPNFRYRIQTFQVPVLKEAAWPSAEKLFLDDSQYRAFKSALTKEFVVIQGPPGTGKTYLGLKIATVIIKNIRHLLDSSNTLPDITNNEMEGDELKMKTDNLDGNMSSDKDDDTFPDVDDVPPDDDLLGINLERLLTNGSCHTPLLVVCFTNHALDQFLEGLLPTTKNIVRIGGQSRNPAMKEFNLKELRYLHKRSTNMHWLTKSMHGEMSLRIANIKGIQEAIEQLEKNNGIISVTCIEKVKRDANLDCFKGCNNELSDEMLLQWLLGDEGATYNLNGYSLNSLLDMYIPPPASIEPTLPPPPNGKDAEEDYNTVELDDDFGLEELPKSVKLKYALCVPFLDNHLIYLRSEIRKLENKYDEECQLRLWELEAEHELLDFRFQTVAHWLNNKPKSDLALIRSVMAGQVKLTTLNPEQRWSVYLSWVSRLEASLLEELRREEETYCVTTRQYEETRHMEDLKLIEGADVVGLTTTGAARLQPLLQALKSRIVIVEEAAEVMESHIIVSLTSHCEHIILIGDHQQLRPTTAVYRLARDFNFDISLFERMLKNGLHCEVLKVQHRMRPEISKLIVPSIYKELIDHDSVLHFPNVRGVTKSLFFITHNNPEQEVGETHSRCNKFEADFLLSFCKYLLMQEYPPERITILTTYSGQMFYLRNERKKSPMLECVQMTIVDNFQGEENDIILLSLVRNNAENNIGFLKTENRVCVALSRAKRGFYIMGNMDNLTNSSSIWPQIKEQLDAQQAVGESLALYCPVHDDQKADVRSAADFSKVPEGGCLLPCATTLVCGHICKNLCHARDRDHTSYNCRDPCERVPPDCILLHPCPKLCFELCGVCLTRVERELPCGHKKGLACYVDHLTYKCLEKVSVTDPDCGHTFDKACHAEKGQYHCPHPCNIRLDCGHSCSIQCHVNHDPDHVEYKCLKQCTRKNEGCTQDHMCTRVCSETCGLCLVPTLKTAPHCGHTHKVFCSTEPEAIVCSRKCKATLDCGHPCPLKCFEPCGSCLFQVEKVVPECNHKVRLACSEVVARKHCRQRCKRKMACGHDCKDRCAVTCGSGSRCEALVTTPIKPACGHDIQVPCGLLSTLMTDFEPDSPELLAYCKEPCKVQLKCGHECVGTCGGCLQGRIHQSCRTKCGRNLICGHGCTEPCAQICPPCTQWCRLKCKHSRCNKRCGVPCSLCQEPCLWKCAHTKCTNRCGQLCNRKPCEYPCKQRLRCKHPCIGFCGEPCPKLCRICNKEEVTAIVFGNEDDPEARFVYLVDCKHTVESRALDTWLDQKRNEVVMPQCPLCKTNIMSTMRCMNQVKQVLWDVLLIKRKIFGEIRAIGDGRRQLQLKLKSIWDPYARRKDTRNHVRIRFALDSPVPLLPGPDDGDLLTSVGKLLHKNLFDQVQEVNGHRRNNISIVDLQSLTTKIDIFSEIDKSHKKVRRDVAGISLTMLTERTDTLLSILLKLGQVNLQVAEDLNLELQRYDGITQLCLLETRMWSQPINPEATKHYNTARKIAFSFARYSDDQHKRLIESLKKLNDIVKAGMVVSSEERRAIAKAVTGLKQGSWFKCPNGHYYSIGDCGGAMQQSRCADCGATIGGQRHQLLRDNHFAPEMDGAAAPAWPGAAMNH